MLKSEKYKDFASFMKHHCCDDSMYIYCEEQISHEGKLMLYIEVDNEDSLDDGFYHEVEVSYCPFCGYSPKQNDEKNKV